MSRIQRIGPRPQASGYSEIARPQRPPPGLRGLRRVAAVALLGLGAGCASNQSLRLPESTLPSQSPVTAPRADLPELPLALQSGEARSAFRLADGRNIQLRLFSVDHNFDGVLRACKGLEILDDLKGLSAVTNLFFDAQYFDAETTHPTMSALFPRGHRLRALSSYAITLLRLCPDPTFQGLEPSLEAFQR